MEENTRITVRLPSGLVEQLEEMISKGRFDNISEAVEDCVRRYIESNPITDDEVGEKKGLIRMESLVADEVSMEELIRDAAKKYVSNHMP